MTEERLRGLLAPFVDPQAGRDCILPADIYPQLTVYLDLLLRWNARTNLTAIREPDEIVKRHFGEGLYAARWLRPYAAVGARLLDVGSGAGFPGLPIQLAIPALRVTLAESQGKKASFLREAVRVLGVPAEVWAGRVEDLPRERCFDLVTLRAVDRMREMLAIARGRLVACGMLLELTTQDAELLPGMELRETPQLLPGSSMRALRLWRRVD